MGNLLPKILGWLVVIITLALAPTINTSNTAVDAAWAAATNNATMIGMDAVLDFGAPLMIIGLLFAGTLLGLGKIGDGTIKGMMSVIGAIVLVIVALSLFESVIDYVDTLITASTGFAQTVYGIIPIILYVAIIASAGIYAGVKGMKGGAKSNKGYA